MARADLLCELIRYGLANDMPRFKMAAKAISAQEKAMHHSAIAANIDALLESAPRKMPPNAGHLSREGHSKPSDSSLFLQKTPQKTLDQLLLPDHVKQACLDLVHEQQKFELLQSYGIEPRNKLLLIGPPGNGKTSLAEAIAQALNVPLLVVRYESIIGSYLGETATRLSQLFEYAKSQECVLFFDEFETLGKERGDVHETGEIKRVVSSLLMQIDELPSHVIAIAATNHDSLLDKAAWRRFQIRMELPKPTQQDLEDYYRFFEQERKFELGISPQELANQTQGISFAEAEEFALTILRQYILALPNANVKEIMQRTLANWKAQAIFCNSATEKSESI